MVPKITDLRHIATELCPDILAVSETWLSKSIPTGAMNYTATTRSSVPTDKTIDEVVAPS